MRMIAFICHRKVSWSLTSSDKEEKRIDRISVFQLSSGKFEMIKTL
jgi:hypothetical protein